MNRDIQIVVKDRVARAVGQPAIVCGNCDYTVTFSFDDEWGEAGTKTARFKYLTAEGMKHMDKELTGNKVQVPMLSNIREVEVGVYAGGLATSTGAPIRCEPSVRCGSGEEEQDIVQSTIEATQEACRAELETSLETATGENLDGKTWDELKDTVSALPIVTPEKQEAIDGFELVKIAVENYPIGRSGSYTATSHGLFNYTAHDASGNQIDFRLPYFNTSRAKWEYVTTTQGKRIDYFSSHLREIGLDCTSAVNFGTYQYTASIFEYMKKLKLTNVSCPIDGAFRNCKELKYLEIYGVDGFVRPTDLRKTFENCNGLIEVLGDEFDLSNVLSGYYAKTFAGCTILQYIRFKPFSLKASLDFGDCQYLHYKPHSYPLEFDCGTILSILNAIPNPPEEGDNPNANITVTFHDDLAEYLGGTLIVFDEDTGLWYYKKPEEITPEDTIVTDINGAFVAGKGVTLAWKN